MLNEITRQAYELKFCKKVFSMMLRPDEIARIRSKSNFDEAEDDWKVPAFIFKQKELIFPKLNGMALVGDAIENRAVHILDTDNSRKASRERHGTKSTNLSDKKSRNDKIHDTLSSGGEGFGIGSQSHRGATSISKEIRKMSNNLRFNTQNVGAEGGM